MDQDQALEVINNCLTQALARGLGNNGLVFPVECKEAGGSEFRCFCENLETIFSQINEVYHFAGDLANGKLKSGVSRANVFAMPLKALQASLRHLTWQTNQVAEGDLNQKVDFLGEFSQSFNRMIESLREKQSLEVRLKSITDVLGEGVFLVDPEGSLILANPEAERLLGYRFQEMAGEKVLPIIREDCDRDAPSAPEESPLAVAIGSGEPYNNNDCLFTCQSGSLLPVALACRPVINGKRLDGAVLAFHDITEQKKYQQSLEMVNNLLEKQATTDALTGAFNRLKLSKMLAVEMSRARRYSSALAVLMFDIDKFKVINDTFGHQLGDSVLIDIARVVNANIRDTDIFARWGGEEFMIIAPGCTLEQGGQFADMLRKKVAQTAFAILREVTVSFGVAAFRADDNEISLTNRVDQALYKAKNHGRNRVETEEAVRE